MNTVNLPGIPTANVLHCLDRIVLTGTAIGLHHAGEMKKYLEFLGLSKRDFSLWAMPHTLKIKEYIKSLSSNLGIELVPSKNSKKIGRKDDYAKSILSKSNVLGPFLIIESMEVCRSYRYAITKGDDRDFYGISTKCLHYYIYINDPILGLINVRVQTYAPFATQIIVNGHRILHEMLIKHNVKHIAKDNAITQCDSIDKAQDLSDRITDEFIIDNIKRIFREYIPCLSFVPCGYRLTIRQIEYSTDIIFQNKVNIHERYTAMIPRLLQQKPDDILRFTDGDVFSKEDIAKLECRYYQTRFGSCIKFTIGNVSIKMYTKDDLVLRIETTCRDMESIRGLRTVFHKDGSRSIKRRPLTRSIYSLQLFINYARRANNRFTDTVQTAMNDHYSCRDLKQTTTSIKTNGRSMKGFNYFDPLDQRSIIAISNEKLNLLPFSRATFKSSVGDISDYQASHLLKRLRSHGLIKKLPKSRLYYPTKIGKKACLTMMYMTNEVVKPIMAA